MSKSVHLSCDFLEWTWAPVFSEPWGIKEPIHAAWRSVSDENNTSVWPGSYTRFHVLIFRVSAKSKAPSPPGLKTLESSDLSQWYAGGPHLTMDVKENLIDQDLSLAVVLPDGEERMTTVHGRYCPSSPDLISEKIALTAAARTVISTANIASWDGVSSSSMGSNR